MPVTLPEPKTRPHAIRLGDPLNNDEFYELCMRNPDVRIERDANGDIIIMPPAGFETSNRNSGLSQQLDAWAEQDGRGLAFGPDTEFLLPKGQAYGPDAGWVSNSRLDTLSDDEWRRFLPLCPEFVVELMSPSDRLSQAMAKMQEWMDNGAALGWLIDADQRTVYIYRPSAEPEKQVGVNYGDGEGPVEGFRLDLRRICRKRRRSSP